MKSLNRQSMLRSLYCFQNFATIDFNVSSSFICHISYSTSEYLVYFQNMLPYSTIFRNCARQKVAPLLGEDLPHSLFGGHARPRPAPRATSPRQLSRLFFTSKFPKPARQSTGDRTADVPPTMSFWALALHKRGNPKNDGDREGEGGCGERNQARMNTGVRGTTVSKVPRAARADLTMHTSRVPLAFRLSLLVPSPLASGLP